MPQWIRALHVLGIVSLPLAACGGSTSSTRACSGSTTLESLVACIDTQMPKTDGYVAPTPGQRDDWRSIVTTMLEGSCDTTIPSNLTGVVQVRTFTDADNGRDYCLLMEVQDQDGNGVVDRGLGAFIVYSGAVRQLNHQAVHPLADSGTEREAVTVFKKTDSRSFLMAGAHRDASKTPSTCLRSHPESDASHNSDMVVQATNEALLAYYAEASWFVIQWHGMAAARCPNTDVYMSHGLDVAPDPTDKIMLLSQHVLAQHSDWGVDLPGSNACPLNATDNVQGRLLNGIAADRVCGPDATAYSGKFLHIEQDPNFRNPDDWIAPVVSTFP